MLQARLINQHRKIFSWLLEVKEAHDCSCSAVLDYICRLLSWSSALSGAIMALTGPVGWAADVVKLQPCSLWCLSCYLSGSGAFLVNSLSTNMLIILIIRHSRATLR